MQFGTKYITKLIAIDQLYTTTVYFKNLPTYLVTILKALIVVNKTAIKMHNQSCLMQTEYCNVQKISDKDLLFATD